MSSAASSAPLPDAGQHILNKKRKNRLILTSLAIALAVTFSMAIIIGSSNTGLKEMIGSILTSLGFSSPWPLEEMQKFIITELRLPRAIVAVSIGATLAIGGVAMQGLFRNPLADPGLLGVNSGAALGASLIIVLGNSILPEALNPYKIYAVPVGAFMCALSITYLIVKIGTVNGRANIFILLLTGVALQAIIGALMGLLTYISDDQQLRSLSFWNMGDLGVASWKEIVYVIPAMAFCSWRILRSANSLNLFLLGELEAQHLGIDVQKLKNSIIVWTSLSIAMAVSFTGSIGFIGLAAPHLVRLMCGPNHKTLFPGAAIMGALILCFSDILSRSIHTAEIPVGIITASIGGPVFLWLLLLQRKEAHS